MAHRARLVLRLLTLSISMSVLTSQCVFAQETSAKDPTENAPPGQTSAERNAKSSATHCEFPACVHKILYFSNLSQPTELQDVVNAIRVITEIQRAQQVIASDIIIVEGTAEQVTVAEKLAAEIDSAKVKRRFGGLGYRIDLKIQATENDKKLPSHLYSFTTDAHQNARVTVGKQAPAPVKAESGSENRQSPDSNNTTSIECRILADYERLLELNVDASFTADAESPVASVSPLHRVNLHVTVELDKPTVIGRIDDPNTGRSYAIELTASRIKERS